MPEQTFMTTLAAAGASARRRRFFGIRSRLFALVLATLLPFVILTIFNLVQEVRDHRVIAHDRALAWSHIINARVDDLFNNVDTLLLALPHLVSTDKADADKNDQFLRAMKKDLPSYIHNISVWTPEGKNIGGTAVGVDRAAADISDRKYFRLAIENRGLGVGEPVISRVDRVWTLSLARPLLNPDGQIEAVVAISIHLEKFQDLLDLGTLPPGSVITLFTDQGIVVVRTGNPSKWIGKNLSDLPWLKAAIDQREGAKEVVGADGVTRLSGYTTARKAPWLIYVGMPTEIALAEQRAELRLGIALGGLSLLFALILAWLISKRVTTPILRLAQDTAILAAGNLAHRSRVKATSEVGLLAENFNQMARALESRSLALRQSENRLRTIIESEPECVKVLAPDGKVVEMNAAGLQMIEADSLLDVQHRPLLEFVAPEHHEAFLALQNQVMQGERGTLEFEIIGRRGTRRWLDTHSVPLRNHGQEVVALLGISRDITERKRAEEALQARYQELQILSDISRNILNSLDLREILHTILDKVTSIGQFDLGLIRLHNKTLGIIEPVASRGFQDPENVENLRVPVSDRSTDSVVRSVMTERTTLALEILPDSYRLSTIRREGVQSIIFIPIRTEEEVLGILQLGSRTPRKFPPNETRLLESIGNHLGLAVQKASLYENTQRNLARIQALREIDLAITSTLELKDTLNILLDKIDVFLPYAVATVRFLNKDTGELEPAACRNIDEEEWKSATGGNQFVLGKFDGESFAPLAIRDAQTNPRSFSREFLRKHGLKSLLRVPLIAKNDFVGMLTFLTREEHEFTGEEVGFLTTLAGQAALAIHNSQLYEQTKRQAAELAQANQVKSEFLSVMSHELRTPLNLIMGYTGMMQDKTLGQINQEQESSLGKIMRCSHDLLEMIITIMEASRIEAGETKVNRAELDLGAFLDDLKLVYECPLDKEVDLRWDYPSSLPPIRTDSTMLKHILQNLINNAIKFTEQGHVTVSARYLSDSREVEYRVADTGPGIPKESLPNIFEMFRQLDSSMTRPFGGMGLGLFIVKKYTELLGGTVKVESEPGKGSTFTVILPLESPHRET